MARPFRILVAESEGFTEAAFRIFAQAGDVTLRDVGSVGELSAAFSEFDVIFVRLRFRITRDVLPKDPQCRLLAVPTTGLDHIDLEACAERGIEVVSLSGEREFLREVRATAEHTVGLALALIRNLPQAASSVLDGAWERDRFRGRELFEKTVGIVGLGRLGAITAGYFHALGMRVLGYDIRSEVEPSPATRVDSLEELLGRCDVVSLHVKYTPETRHLIDSAELGRMRAGAILINTSRGGVVNESALLEALDSGHLAGAALDVLDGEPDINSDHPVVRYARAHDNLLITPHVGGNTYESFEKTEIFIAQRILERLGVDDQHGPEQ